MGRWLLLLSWIIMIYWHVEAMMIVVTRRYVGDVLIGSFIVSNSSYL